MENVKRKLPVMRALFHYHEVFDVAMATRFAESLPHLDKLRGQQLSKERPDADVREIITLSPNRTAAGGVISMLEMIERLLHEPGKRLRSALFNLRANQSDEIGITGIHSLTVPLT